MKKSAREEERLRISMTMAVIATKKIKIDCKRTTMRMPSKYKLMERRL